MRSSIILATLPVLLALGCGGHSLSGTYLPQGGGLGNGLVMQQLDFVNGDQVDIKMMEQTVRANYKIDGNDVLLIVNGQQEVFKLDDKGCLDGGHMFGKFCKG